MDCVRSMVVLLLMLGCPATALAADVGQNFAWRGPIPLGDTTPLPAGGHGAVAAFGDGVHLVAFVRDLNLAFTRLDADGNLLDPVPVLIDGPDRHIQEVDVAWNGTRFLVVWRYYWFDILGRFIRPDGSFDGETFHVTKATFGRGPEVASNGDTFLVTGGEPGNTVIVSGSGRVTSLNHAALPWERPDIAGVATDGETYLMLLQQHSSSLVAPLLLRVNDDATSSTLAFRPEIRNAELAWTGDRFMLAGFNSGVKAYEVSREGEVIGGPHALFSDPVANARLTLMADGRGGVIIAGAAASTLLRWSPDDDTAIAIAAPAPTLTPLTSASGRPLLAFQESGFLRHTFLEADDTFTEPRPTLFTAPAQSPAKMEATQAGWFSVWTERRGDATDVRGAVLSYGSLARQTSFSIGQGVSADVAASPDSVLVVWGAGNGVSGIQGRRYTHGGVPLDDAPFMIAPNGYKSGEAVAWNGRYFLLVVRRAMTNTLALTRVTADGSVLDPEGIPLPVPEREAGFQYGVSMAVAGDTTLVTWQDGIPFQECWTLCIPMPASRIEAVPLDIEGNPMWSSALVLSGQPDIAFRPAVGAAGGRFLAVWRSYNQVVARLLDGVGTPIGREFAIHHDELSGRDTASVSVTELNDRFVVVWDSPLAPDRRRLQGQIIGNRGVVLDPVEIPLEIRVRNGVVPFPFVYSDDGDLVLLFSRWSEEHGGVSRNFMLTTGETPAKRRGVRPN